MKYKNVKNDTFKAIKDILSFIEINISDEAINWSSFDNMKKMESNQQNIDLFKPLILNNNDQSIEISVAIKINITINFVPIFSN